VIGAALFGIRKADLVYKALSSVDLGDYKKVFEFSNSTKHAIQLALEPWATAIDVHPDDVVAIYTSKDFAGGVEYSECNRRERLVSIDSELMVVAVNGVVIANLPVQFPELA
jgi:hypothetical protein